MNKEDRAIKLLEEIKILMIAQLARQGVSSEAIGQILGISTRRVQQMLPMKSIKEQPK